MLVLFGGVLKLFSYIILFLSFNKIIAIKQNLLLWGSKKNFNSIVIDCKDNQTCICFYDIYQIFKELL
jgi:hypothetical protein